MVPHFAADSAPTKDETPSPGDASVLDTQLAHMAASDAVTSTNLDTHPLLRRLPIGDLWHKLRELASDHDQVCRFVFTMVGE